MTKNIEDSEAKTGAIELGDQDLEKMQGGISLVTPIVQGARSGETKNPSHGIQVALGDGSVR